MIEKFKAYTEAHKEVWQLIKFTLASMAAGATELILFAILQASLKGVNKPFNWFIFHYGTAEGGKGGGVGAFIAFLLSTSLAQIVAFTVNRKKTFKSDMNLAFAIPAYIVMVVVFIIGLNTYLAAVLIKAMSGINTTLAEYIAKIITMLLAFVVTFVFSKYVIMREKKTAPTEGGNSQETGGASS